LRLERAEKLLGGYVSVLEQSIHILEALTWVVRVVVLRELRE